LEAKINILRYPEKITDISRISQNLPADITIIAGGGVRTKVDAELYLSKGADHISISTICFNPLLLSFGYVILWICYPLDMLSFGYVILWICYPLDMLSFGYVILWIYYPLDMLSFGYVILWICYPLDMLSFGYVILWICYPLWI